MGSFKTIRRLIKAIHRDERGQVSIENVLIIAAISLPILIFIYKVGWPRIKNWWEGQMDTLEEGSAAISRETPCC